MILKNKHIFIVEDNASNRVIFQVCLVKHGAVISFERSGRETLYTLKQFADNALDLIIMDLMLTDGLSGFDVFDEIRAIPQFAQTPIVAVSAAEPSQALPKAKDKGFAGFIAKPINDMLFPKQISQIIEGQQVWYAGERFTI